MGPFYLAIDPGASPGWCALDPFLRICACGAGEAPLSVSYRVVLIERPTIYARNPVPAADIVTLALTAGMLARPHKDKGAKLRWVEPRSWKGSIKKKPHHAATKRAISAPERFIVEQAEKTAGAGIEDMLDAVALAVYGRRMHIFD